MNWLQKYCLEVILVIVIGVFMIVLVFYDIDWLLIWLCYIYWIGLMVVGWGFVVVIQLIIVCWVFDILVWVYFLCLLLFVSVFVMIGVLFVQSVWGLGFLLQVILVVFGFVWVIFIGVSVIGWFISCYGEQQDKEIDVVVVLLVFFD